MYLVGKKRCPHCGVKGNSWRKDTDVLVCPGCNVFFNEFGIVLSPENRERMIS
ncbi:MAG: hypothetical protein JW700_00140 [Candidatus Aenigmarchaeota archaeon]|nr:hypothetical protein [Candidatus Aenigmarchaeota archaeon]